jgi:endonuclease-3
MVRAAQILQQLSKDYNDLQPNLRYGDCFQLLISVILSAQTTDEQVNQATPELFKRYPDAQALSTADQETVEQLIHGVGFFHVKAKHIREAAKIVYKEFQGTVPADLDTLLTLPGVGRKSANVIMGFCFGEPAVIVDTHFMRVCRRTGITDAENPEMIEREVRVLIQPEDYTRFSMTVNRHGRLCCHARKPRCFECSIENICSYSDKVYLE